MSQSSASELGVRADVMGARLVEFEKFRGHWESRKGQTMSSFLQTFSEEFKKTLIPQNLWETIREPPSLCKDTESDISSRDTGRTVCTIFVHATLRKKLFDRTVSNDPWYATVRLTLAWLEDHSIKIVVDKRSGVHSHYLDQSWRGYTILYHRA